MSNVELSTSNFEVVSRRPGVRVALALVLALGVSACRGTEIEDLIGKVPWFSNMRDQPAVEPFEEKPRQMPDGTFPVGGAIPLAPGQPDAYAEIPNPVPATPASLERGRELFRIYCAVCHGPQGQGGGNIEGPFPAGLIPQLLTARAREFSDGFLFGMITGGRGLMPNYLRIPEEERWDIVNHVRELQSLPVDGDD